MRLYALWVITDVNNKWKNGSLRKKNIEDHVRQENILEYNFAVIFKQEFLKSSDKFSFQKNWLK